MKIKASVISHLGKVRKNNEDNFFFNEFILQEEKLTKPYKMKSKTDVPILMGVFDGMGGISAGERASLITATTARNVSYTLYDPDEIDSTLLRICKSANEVVCNEMLNVIKGRMGTTASMLCFFEEHYHLCNIGDSPIFLFRDNKLSEISYEHTEKENYILIYGEENVPKDKKFRLTQHIGIFPEELQIEPYLSCDEIKKGDRFVICSDGLTDMVKEPQLVKILSAYHSPVKALKKLLNAALDNGGRDNITIIVIVVC